MVPPSDFADDGADRAIADLMGIEVSTLNGDAAVVRVTGEVDGYTAPVFQRAVDEGFSQGGHRVLIDLDRVEFFGTGGLAVLVEARARALREKVGLFLVCSNRIVLRPIELAGLIELFSVRTSAETALS
ncbi:MAG TPA: anti-sigma factor antagonist [Pseudonocardia sp.]|nr:anti-sigma factor antagonist [Pseudonocardia sp.]